MFLSGPSVYSGEMYDGLSGTFNELPVNMGNGKLFCQLGKLSFDV